MALPAHSFDFALVAYITFSSESTQCSTKNLEGALLIRCPFNGIKNVVLSNGF
ncbi:hypothetical protein ADU37_CDS17820 [Thermococcus sp. 2319x1]|nr:hypothetical protein ADU37_CDS17820 [Thermococcus sp. 2319x1]